MRLVFTLGRTWSEEQGVTSLMDCLEFAAASDSCHGWEIQLLQETQRFTEEIMSTCLYYWRHYVSQFYSASLNSMFKIHFKKVAKYLLWSTKPLIAPFFHALYACEKEKFWQWWETLCYYFILICLCTLAWGGKKLSENSAKSIAEHRNFPF